MVSVPPPVDVLKITVPPILIDCRLPLIACGQVMDSPVSTWATAVLFWNVIVIVFPANVLLVTMIVAGVAVGVGVAVAVAVAVAVGVNVAVGVGVNVAVAVGVNVAVAVGVNVAVAVAVGVNVAVAVGV